MGGLHDGYDIRSEDSPEQKAIEAEAALRHFCQVHLPNLLPAALLRLKDAVSELIVDDDDGDEDGLTNNEYGAGFSLAEEIGAQIEMVRQLRKHFFPGGKIRQGVEIKEVKEVIATTNTMLKTLMQNHKEVMDMERQRKVEAATVDVLIEMATDEVKAALGGLDFREVFLKLLEEKLEDIE